MFHSLRSALVVMLLAIACSVCLAGEGTGSIVAPPPTVKTKIACVGDSITAGYGVSPGNAYPNQLARMLGPDWTVANFGVSGSTLLIKGDLPYQKHDAFTRALASNPDIVIIMLGTNDTKAQNWKSIGDFAADYKTMIEKFAALESKPRIFVVRPCVVVGAGAFGISEANLKSELPMIDAVAKEANAGVVDIHSVTEAAAKANPALIPDNVHPNAEGAAILAAEFYKAIAGKEYTGPSCIVSPKPKTATTKPAAK